MANPILVPPNIKTLIQQRQVFRDQGDFSQADEVRNQIHNLGYQLLDKPDGTEIIPHEPKPTGARTTSLTLFGSGEISSTGRKAHDLALTLLGKKQVRIAIITTPAGFQPNVTTVYGEIADFFYQSLANFHPQVKIIYANQREDANNQSLIEPLNSADYVFTGPGSPTYAINHLKDSLLLNTLIQKVKHKEISLSLASAATIAFSHLALPVYEIYKVGAPLHWQPGLDVFTEIYQPLTIIPHYNNSEGGTKTDTSYCYMGHDRFLKLKSLLPQNEKLWGLDERTGVVINLTSLDKKVIGTGKLHDQIP